MDFPIQGMDFLQSNISTGAVGGNNLGNGGMGNENGGWDNTGAGGIGGMDLGFGLGWEGMDHDFSEGGQLDLFEGFFFGGTGGY